MSEQVIEQLKEATKDILSDESLNDIEAAFNEAVNEKVQLHVEKALMEQDSAHAEKLKNLLEAIDNDHTKKLEALVEAIDKDHSGKLNAVVRRHQGILSEQANSFKSELVEQISNYMELYLDKVAPADMLKEAVTNKRAIDFLGELRNLLAVDSALQNESVREAVIDGKTKIDRANYDVNELQKENDKLKGQLKELSAQMTLETKCNGLPEEKKAYVLNLLKDKDVQFINENFDYTVDMFDMTETQRLDEMKAEAVQETKSKDVDRPVLEESVEPTVENSDDPIKTAYMKELGKY